MPRLKQTHHGYNGLVEFVSFRVPGDPGPGAYRVPGQPRPKSWMNLVQQAAFNHGERYRLGEGPMAPPYLLSLRFTLPRPAEPQFVWPTPGAEAVQATINALTFGGLLRDPRHIVALNTRHTYAVGEQSTGCHIAITSLYPETV